MEVTTMWIVLASVISTLLGLSGAVLLLWRKEWARRATIVLLSFAAGTMLGAVFFDLLPEAIEATSVEVALPFVLAGLLVFFLIEKGLLIYHCHESEDCDTHRMAASKWLIVIGDFVHNMLDGVIIATAFLVSAPLGVIATVAVVAHEIPQEIGDFSILLASGMARRRIVLWNLISGVGSLVGALAVIALSGSLTAITNVLLPIAAGGFLYIASADLIPELHREVRFRHSLVHLAALAVGLAVIYGVGNAFAHG